MSKKSSRARSVTGSSILRKNTSIRNRLDDDSSTTAKVRFVLPHNKKVRNIIQEFIRDQANREYENLVCLIRDAELLDNEIVSLLQEATACISLLNHDLRLFIEALCLIKWYNRSDEVVNQFRTFVVSLLSAHNYHAKLVIDHLVSNFFLDSDDPEWPNGIPTAEDCKKCVNIHAILSILINDMPMCNEIIMKSLISNFPYIKRPTHVHELYLHNLLWILDYQPKFRYEILHLIFTKLVKLDVNADREEIEQMEYTEDDEMFLMEEACDMTRLEESTKPNRMKHPIAHTLDVCMDRMFNYIINECLDQMTGELNWENTKSLYHALIETFNKVILPTYNTHHVQFVMFLICCFKPTITEAFLNFLWKKVVNPNTPTLHRKTSIAYIASLIARGVFVPLSMVKGTLQQMAEWILSYISEQDGLECQNSDVRVHSVFYSTCQALFYIIAFRHKDLVNTKKNIVFLESLNLAKMVTCRLNPLRVCQPTIVQKFAAITRTYQLAYCYSVMEHNARSVLSTIYEDEKGSVVVSNSYLDSFFPFEPYILKRSSQKIYPYYRDYEEFCDKEDASNEKNEIGDVDDFLNEPSTSLSSRFSYSSSPGFKQRI